jgi:cytochrome c556
MRTLQQISLTCLFLGSALSWAGAQEPTTKKELSTWMKSKLVHSQSILEGMASGDFDQIAASAQTMNNLSKIESFVRGRFPKYRSHLTAFQEANEEIISQANDKNLEGVALGFNQLTLSCIQCHKQLRAQTNAEKK